MMKQLHPELYELLAMWYGSLRPMEVPTAQELLNLWQDLWFAKGTKQSQADVFLKKFEMVLDALVEQQPLSTLDTIGMIILYDQIPRNIYRGNWKAWSYDERAQQLAKGLRHQQIYENLPSHFKLTLCICMLHSQCLKDQEDNKLYIESLKDKIDGTVYKALYQLWTNHYDRVRLYGRIPQRNKALGRVSTEQQLKYLEAMEKYT